MLRICVLITLLCLCAPAHGQTTEEAQGLAAANAKLKTYETPYYIMHTDLPLDQAREAAIRMTKMFEEYKKRTAQFSGTITEKFPFYLFKNPDDYYAAGALAKTGGVFIMDMQGDRLMAIAGHGEPQWTWHTIQHEGFHQFAHAVIRGQLPIWLNEGLAEYFGEGIFTGDNFVTGVISPERLAYIKAEMATNEFKPLRQIMQVTPQQWRADFTITNYDQVWSMVHFLAHGDNGKYQAAMVQFITSLGRGVPYETAWINAFGSDINGFEAKWKAWWMALPDDPTALLYRQATVETLTSFMARAFAQGQKFSDADAFFTAAQNGNLKAAKEDWNDWLPPSLLAHALDQKDGVGTWTLFNHAGGLPQLVLVTDDGTKLTGAFTLSDGHVKSVTCDVAKIVRQTPRPAPTHAAAHPAATSASTLPGKN